MQRTDQVYATDRSVYAMGSSFSPRIHGARPNSGRVHANRGTHRCKIGETRDSMWTWARRGQNGRTVRGIPANTREPGPARTRAALIVRMHVNLGPHGPERPRRPGHSCQYMRTGLRTDESGSDARTDVNLAPRGPDRLYHPRYSCEDVRTGASMDESGSNHATLARMDQNDVA